MSTGSASVFLTGIRSPRIGMLLMVLLGATQACSDDSVSPPPFDNQPASLHLVLGSPVADSIDAVLHDPVVVEVRNAEGQPIPGARVRFTGSSILVSQLSPEGLEWAATISALTDPLGRAGTGIRLGPLPGTGRLRASSGGIPSHDLVLYEISPGNLHSVMVAPGDTAALPGSSYPIRVSTLDRHDNVVAVVPAFEGENEAVATVSADGEVTAEAIGRTTFKVIAGDLVETVALSVVPQGVVAAQVGPSSEDGQRRLAYFSLDGGEYHVLSAVQDGRVMEYYGVWFAGGIVTQRWPGGDPTGRRLFLTDMEGNTERFLPENHLDREFSAHPSWDGEWLFFTGDHGLFKVNRDRTELVEIPPPSVSGDPERDWPSPSPDGAFLAHVTRTYEAGPRIRILDLQADTLGSLDLIGSAPRWSPRGDWIAYLGGMDYTGALKLVRPDGSDEHYLLPGLEAAWGGFSWSPDGEWLITSGLGRDHPTLIHLETRLELPLAFARGARHLSWRPSQTP